jgi:DNA-binding CsgD family transcriptional regulator
LSEPMRLTFLSGADMAGPFTRTEQKILERLSDGMPHRAEDLFCCLWDEIGSVSAVRFHVSNIRKRLPPGEDIVCRPTNGRGTYAYTHVRIMSRQ